MTASRRGAADSQYLCCFGKMRIDTGACILAALMLLCCVIGMIDYKGTFAMYYHYIDSDLRIFMAGYVVLSCLVGVVASALVLLTRFSVYKMPGLILPILVCNVGALDRE